MVYKIVAIAFLSFTLGACEFHQSVNRDLATDAYSRGDGIGCSSVDMKINGQAEKRNVFIYGEKVSFVFKDLTGLAQKEGKAFPGMSMVIVRNAKDTVASNPDLFADMKQGTDLHPLQLQANFLSNLPFKNQEKYKVCLRIWDKNGKGTFTYEMPFVIRENKLLKIKSRGLDYKEIYLWNESLKQVVTDKDLNAKNAYILILQGLSGMNDADGNVYPVFSIELTDRKGNKILSNPNVLEQYVTSGVLSESVANGQLSTIITFTPGQINNPCTLHTSITDKKSNKRIDIRAEVAIR